MAFKAESQENSPIPFEEDVLIPNFEPIDVNFIKEEIGEDEENEYFVVPGIVESVSDERNSIKDEKKSIKNENNESSSSNVRKIRLILNFFCLLTP